ncbi:MAG: tyrosine-type recombinase/integrase [Ktedonobacteraceae bacterium]|nr:tyrosine-type recombinase/integrase [Ktedonobacteraceae bacterium]
MLQETVEHYIASLCAGDSEQGENKRNTLLAYRNDLNQLCKYLTLQGLEEWSLVEQKHITDYLLTMKDVHAYRPATIARKFAACKAFFRYLYKTHGIADNPIEQLKAPRLQKDLPQVIGAEQVDALLHLVDVETISGKRDLAMLRLLYATGLRASELVALNVADFDPGKALMHCAGVGGLKRERMLPLPVQALEALQCYLQEARPQLLCRADEPALFLNHRGERLTRQGFWLIIKRYAYRAGISDVTPHALRHHFAVAQLKEGKELDSVRELLGHAHISTTQIYSQLAESTPG